MIRNGGIIVAMIAVRAPIIPASLYPPHDCPVDRDCSRSGLCDGDQIQHLVLLDPVVLITNFFFIRVTITYPPPNVKALR